MFRLFTISCLAALCVFAQGARTQSLSGHVLDPSAAAVPGATVRLYNRDSSFLRTAVADAQGAYRLDDVPAGEFLLEGRTGGLDQVSAVSVTVEPGKDQTVDLKLDIRGLASRVLVTATANPVSTAESGKAMDVVDSGEMARRQVITFPEAIKLTAGLRVQQLGGPGSFTRILTRGLRATDTGVLIDGMRLRDPASVQGDATAFLGDMQLIATDRVEVLRGLGSSLYGTNATAGVINMVTDQGGGALRGELTGEGGGLGLFRGMARVAGGMKNDKFQYSAGLAELNVNGGVDGIENVRNTSGLGYALWRPSASTSLSGRVWGTAATVGINSNPQAAPLANLPSSTVIPAIPLAADQARLADAGLPFSWGTATFAPNLYDPDSRRVGLVVSSLLSWNQQVSQRFNYRVNYQSVNSNRDNRNGPAGSGYQSLYNSSSIFAGRLDTIQARADWVLAKWNVLSGGYEFERESYENPSTDENPDPAQRVDARASATQRSHSAFFTDQFRLLSDRLQVNLSGRFQGFQLSKPVFEGGTPLYQGATFGAPPNAYTGDVAISYFVPSSSTKLRAHAGNGFRSPTLYERLGSSFYFGSFSALGDPRLRPERTVSADFGVDQYFANSRYRVSASYFYTRLQEVIGYAGLVNDPYGRWGGYVNMGGGLARGVELSGEARPYRSLTLSSSYTYTNADERNSSLIGGSLRAIRVFPQMFTAVATQQVTRRTLVTLSFLGASDYISGSFFVGSGNRPYQFDGPRKLDLAASYTLPLGERTSLRFFTRVENLTNQRYFEDGFRTPGIWATGGLKLAF
ncbi:TonB-dependent receptor [uncultured Paludibaculum sp.]|uniref:TonB-dependent receptor n=1 Tax=uncultured Paludibaculum sp. TaxID=1765020 RepID=UPI002AAB5083|nr:TonB-dependent receptor [uncultured Paludibaculum sp.]